jgi:hypothetical protein
MELTMSKKPLDWPTIIATGKLIECSILEAQTKGIYPNRLAWIKDQLKVGIVVVYRGDTDFAFGKASRDYLNAAKQEGRITEAYIVLLDRDGTFVNAAPLETVKELISTITPWPGKWGEFWWLPAELRWWRKRLISYL